MPDVRPIDANALVKQIKETHCKDCNSYNGVMCRACTWMDAMDYIEDATTVDAQPVKHGKWIIYNLYAQCSECSVAYDFDTFQRLIPMNEKFPRHCSYCGADMRGDTDETK